VLGYWNVVEDGDVGRSDYGADGAAEAAIATDQANTALRQAAQAAVAVFLDTSDALNGDDGDGDPTDLLTSDGDHPNRRGHEAIAQAVYSALPDPKHGPVGLGAPAAQGCLSRYPVGSQDPGRR
jgi:acyl-CoA thioesterase-1